jgi:thiol-disulfide isomerase/thioredoxin
VKLWNVVLAGSVAAGVAAAPLAAQDEEIGLPVGADAPATVILETLDGAPVSLADHVGKKPLLLEFWATWCEVCEALSPRLESAYQRFGDRVEFLIIGVGVNQNPRSIRRHLERHELPGIFLWDGKGAAVRAFAAPQTSYIVTVNAAGKIAYTGIGADQNLEQALERALAN